MTIQLLAEDVVARIAAGEAVERPASAVKELIENAIDAGASSVYVEVLGGGRRRLRVSDNGCGIRAEEVELAIHRHATSKLRAADELHSLRTLGFRGEALASLAAVSHTTIITRHRDEAVGVRLHAEPGHVQRQPLGAPAGTVVAVENLFFNTPARLKFLKSDNTEKRHIHWLVMRYAMAYPKITFTLEMDGRERFRSSGSGKLGDVIARAFGAQQFQQMQALQALEPARGSLPELQVEGYISLPPLSRSQRDRIIFFVNGRAIQDSALSHAVIQAYEGLLKSGVFPWSVLLLRMLPDFVDVNVHPTKAQVRFREPQHIYLALQRAVRQTLHSASDLQPQAEGWQAPSFHEQAMDYRRTRPSWMHYGAADGFDNEGLEYIPAAGDLPQQPRTLPLLRVLGQVGAAYIVAEGPEGLYLVDQQAAHERVLYEGLCRAHADGSPASTEATEPRVFLLAPRDAAQLQSLAELFAALGFELEPFGPNTFRTLALPTIAAASDADLLPRMLAQLPREAAQLEDGWRALAAVSATQRGQVLSIEEMRALIRHLERCDSPLQSPRGEKILVHLSRTQLAQQFSQT